MFNTNSQMPEHTTGHIEGAVRTPRFNQAEPDTPASVRATNIPQLEGKSWLERKYNVAMSGSGNPYFKPIEHILKDLTNQAGAALNLALESLSEDANQKHLESIALAAKELHDPVADWAGEDKKWLADQIVLRPWQNQIGYNLFQYLMNYRELESLGVSIARNSPTAITKADLENDSRYATKKEWVERSLENLAEVVNIFVTAFPDEVSGLRFDIMLREAYQNAATQDSRKHLWNAGPNASISTDATGGQEDAAIKAMIASSVGTASAAVKQENTPADDSVPF